MKYRGVKVTRGSYWKYMADVMVQGYFCPLTRELRADSYAGIQRLIREVQSRPDYVWTTEPMRYRPSSQAGA